MLAVILLTVRSVPTVYMGQEIGMSITPLRFKMLWTRSRRRSSAGCAGRGRPNARAPQP